MGSGGDKGRREAGVEGERSARPSEQGGGLPNGRAQDNARARGTSVDMSCAYLHNINPFFILV